MASCFFRLINSRNAPGGAPASPITIGGPSQGRTYGPLAAGGYLDVPATDGPALLANGFAFLGLSGATAQRPSPSDPDWPAGVPTNLVSRALGGLVRYLDTTLSAWIVYDESNGVWRDETTLAVV